MKAGDRVYFLEPHRFANKAGVITAGPVPIPDLGGTFYKVCRDSDPSDVEYAREDHVEPLPEDGTFPSRFRAESHGALR